MPQASFHFPTGFMWGCATAAHQVEGNNTNNNWSAWENQPGRIIHGHKAGLADDWWSGKRWKEDMDRAAETGQNAHRLSVEWSRIQPAPDRWDEGALEMYREMVRGIVQRGMTPMVTLHHFTDPLWLVEMGGWENDSAPELFAAFVRKVVEALKEYVSLWVTINEPNVYASCGYLEGSFPPGKKDVNAFARVLRNLVRGHALAYRAVHDIQKTARVGTAINYRAFWPARGWMPLDKTMTNIGHQIYNNAFAGALVNGKLNLVVKRAAIPEAAGTQDFIGVNYYTGDKITFVLNPEKLFYERKVPEGALMSPTGFIADIPEGMFQALKWAKGFKLPIIVTENGVEDPDDLMRPRYLVEHIHQVWRAVNFSFPIKGYFQWSLVDNFEWERGWTQRFGLWGLDVEKQLRIRRKSVDVYAAICKENGITSEMVEQYVPELFPVLFPG